MKEERLARRCLKCGQLIDPPEQLCPHCRMVYKVVEGRVVLKT